MDPITRKLVDTVKQITENSTDYTLGFNKSAVDAAKQKFGVGDTPTSTLGKIMGNITKPVADQAAKLVAGAVKDIRATDVPNTISRPSSSKLGSRLGIAGAALGLASGANAADIVHGLNPLSALDSGSLGTNDMMGEPVEFKQPAPKQQKPLPGSQWMFPPNK